MAARPSPSPAATIAAPFTLNDVGVPSHSPGQRSSRAHTRTSGSAVGEVQMDDDEDRGRVGELLARLNAQSGSPLPTSALGRLRRTTTAAVRTGAGLLVGRLRGRDGIDGEVLERLILPMGEL